MVNLIVIAISLILFIVPKALGGEKTVMYYLEFKEGKTWDEANQAGRLSIPSPHTHTPGSL